MEYSSFSSYRITPAMIPPTPGSIRNKKNSDRHSNPALAATITREASTQTYYTIRYLVDRPLTTNAYRAYAYFRWVDDVIDHKQVEKTEKVAFLSRQHDIITRCYRGERPVALLPEETLVADLIHTDTGTQSGLRQYIDGMMAVMAVDAERKGRIISEIELALYTRSLAMAVTEAMHYFIGHDDASPTDERRYSAVTGAHIIHMLRDAVKDTAAGIYNIPQEFLEANGINPTDISHEAYRTWVRERVALARSCFTVGKAYMAQVKNIRCRLAGYAYIGRFELVLDAIERDDYMLRFDYPERKNKKNVLKITLTSLAQTITRFARLPAIERNSSIFQDNDQTRIPICVGE